MSKVSDGSAPLLRVITKNTTPEEIAALVAVFASLGGGDTALPRLRPQWQAHHRKVRTAVPHGPDGWRNSALPR